MDTEQCPEKVQTSFCQMDAKGGKKQVRKSEAEDAAPTTSCLPAPQAHRRALPAKHLLL